MTSLTERVVRMVRREELLRPGARVVAAVSGGSDSVALVRLLQRVATELDVSVVGLAHVNHGLRGAAADADEQFCRELAVELGLAATISRVEVSRVTNGARLSPEDAARRARYEALANALVQLGGDVVALGHTRDDQAETVMLKLFRGAGARGMGGIYPRNGVFVRPLLDIGRDDLRRWLVQHGYRWVDDETNANLCIPRNLMRHTVLPSIAQAIGRDVAQALARQAAIARADDEVLEALTDAAESRAVMRTGEQVRLDRPQLAAEPTAIQRRVLMRALQAAGVSRPGFDAVESLRELATGKGSSLEFKNRVRAYRIAGGVVLTNSGRDAEAPVQPFRYSLTIPGGVLVPEAGMTVSARPYDALTGPDSDLQAAVDAEAIGGTVIVRNWKAGDALRPAGVGGRKKLQDVFVDRKIPRHERARLPLVANAADHVVWVPGLALDERVRVTERTKAVVVLKLSQAIR